ncbi:MAG: flagellar hook capping FlgD N-terminal domain-containing protein [Terriglobales bacterium]
MTNILSPLAAAATSPNGSSAPPSTTSSSSQSISMSDFMTMLTAEMQNQDPTSPLDPSQFISQLTQVNSLEQLISINQDLTPTSSTSAGTGTGTASPSGSNTGTVPGTATRS